MDRDDIIRMAKDAWLRRTGCVWTEPKHWSKNELVRFAELISAAEREAVIAIVNDNSDSDGLCCTDDLLAAIRARGDNE